MHSNYLYGENENHIQFCATTEADSTELKFRFYSKWNCESTKDSRRLRNNVVQQKKTWPYRMNELGTGFQCYSNISALSVITSIAFQQNASFIPKTLTVTKNVKDDVDLSMDETDIDLDKETVWRKDGYEILRKPNYIPERTHLFLKNVSESSSGIYRLSYKNQYMEKSGFLQLIVRACPEEKYGDNCSKICATCLNGGICHDITGECICAPGFNGSNCEKACEPGFVGKKCNIKCVGDNSPESMLCKGLSICLPSPYGCSCASGFSGLNCDEECSDLFYGAGCLQQHKYVHFKKGSCSKFHDFCDCLDGWHGHLCDESYPVLRNSPTLIKVTERSITVSFSKWSNITDYGSGTPAHYEVVCKEVENHWKKCLKEFIPAKSETEKYRVELSSLKPATNYSIGVIVIDESGNKQKENINVLKITTACEAPSAPAYDIQVLTDKRQVQVQWRLPPKESWNCQGINTTVKVRESSSNITKDCIMKNELFCVFDSDPYTIWNIVVCVSTGVNKEKCAESKQISVEYFISSHVALEIIKKETSLSLSWIPPISNKLSHYVISQGDVDTNSNVSVKVQIQDAACNDNKEYYHCYTINDLKPGHAYKIEIKAYYQNFKEGSLIRSFIVRLEKKSRTLPAVLGICFSLILIICIVALILYIQKRRKKAKSALKVKFFPCEIDNEFGACNEALDEMEIIETESMSEEISNPVSVEELHEYVEQNIQNVKIRKEFMSVPTGQIYPCSVAKQEENKSKNRYGNILPYDHSRVVLDVTEGNSSDYIHASYIHGFNQVKKYIATQGPLSNTVNDFWHMLWKEGTCKILMVTKFMENGKYKCEKYWDEDFFVYGDIKVSLEDVKVYADFIIRTFTVSKGKVSREVKQFHYTTWPDHGAPCNVTPFGYYLKQARNYNYDSDAPIIVHCSAGIGRTGTTILLDSMIDMASQEKKIDVVNHLCSMRKQRMNIVENYDQYVCVYRALVEYLCFEDTSVKHSNFKEEFERLKTVDKVSEIKLIEKQFLVLNQLTVELMYKDVQGAYQQENQGKNRSMLILPPDRARPLLSTSSAYINAVFVDSYIARNAYIATQYPLPETVQDFWCMVHGQKSKIIILLQEMDYSRVEIPQIWLPEGIQEYGDFQITCQSTESEDKMTVVNVLISHKNGVLMDDLPVSIIILKQWAFDKSLPEETSTILSALSKVHSLVSKPADIVTVVCSDGVMACGVFCACLYICDYFKAEKEIDVFHAVKCIRTNRPQFIQSLAQYEFIFEVISAYLDSVKE